MKIIKIKESFTWWELQNFLLKHKKIKMCDINDFMEMNLEGETFWISDKYGEFSSFAFIWNSKHKRKEKITKDSKHRVMVKIDVNDTNNS